MWSSWVFNFRISPIKNVWHQQNKRSPIKWLNLTRLPFLSSVVLIHFVVCGLKQRERTRTDLFTSFAPLLSYKFDHFCWTCVALFAFCQRRGFLWEILNYFHLSFLWAQPFNSFENGSFYLSIRSLRLFKCAHKSRNFEETRPRLARTIPSYCSFCVTFFRFKCVVNWAKRLFWVANFGILRV